LPTDIEKLQQGWLPCFSMGAVFC